MDKKRFNQAILFQNAGVGDFLMAIFLAERLKEAGIVDHISIVVHKGSKWLSGLLATYPYISLLEVSPRRPKSLFRLFALFGKWNLVILPPTIGSFQLKTKFLAWALSKPYGNLIGFEDKGPMCRILYSHTLPYDIGKCFDESINDIIRVLEVSVERRPPRLHISQSTDILKRLELADRRYVLLHPRGGSDRRRLTVDEAKELIDFILATDPGCSILISGAEYERQEMEEMARSARDSQRVIVASGATPAELASLIDHSEIFIGMDTGITHFACFLGKRALVIAKNATANWLPYYHKGATVIFRFAEDERSHTDEGYMWAHQNGRLRPFKDVPIREVNAILAQLLGIPR